MYWIQTSKTCVKVSPWFTVNHGMIKNTKPQISWKRNIIFLWNSVYMIITLHFWSLYLTQSIYIAALQFLINWNEKWCNNSNILAMDQELVLENSSSAAVYMLPNIIIYLKAIKYLNIRLRQIYWTDLKLKIRVQKIEDWMLFYGCKDSGLPSWKLKTLW